MKKIIELIEKYWVILFLGLFIGIPLLINIAFKIPAICCWFSYEQEAGDIISYYASIISSIGTIFLGYVAYKQNERLLKVEEASKKGYVLLDTERTEFYRNGECMDCNLLFEKITDVPIVKWDIVPSSKIIVEGYRSANVKKVSVDNVAQVINLKEDNINTNIILNSFQEDYFILSFKVIMTSIYRYKTEQLFSIVVHNEQLIECATYEYGEEDKDT